METGEKNSPQRHAVVVGPDGRCQALETVGENDVLHDVEVELPFVGLGPVCAVWSVDEVAGYVVGDEGFGEAEGGRLVLAGLENADVVLSGDRLRH